MAPYWILALTVTTALVRPRFGPIRIQPYAAALAGALLMVAIGGLPVRVVGDTLRFLARPALTIVSLMIITLVANRAGLFQIVAHGVARRADGDGRRLFGYLFGAGTACGMLFTNDAAILIFTPLVFQLLDDVQEPGWSPAQKVPFYFAVLYAANLVGAFVTSNPINVVVGDWFHIGFAEYARWMMIPALSSMIVSYLGLRWFFRHDLPRHCRRPGPMPPVPRPWFLALGGLITGLTLLGFWTEKLTGVPTAYVAAAGALMLLFLAGTVGESPLAILRGVSWDVIAFVAGMLLVAQGLRAAGLTDLIGNLIIAASELGNQIATLIAGVAAGGLSAVINNHPVAGTMAIAIEGLPLPDATQRLLALSALIGGDLGPRMLPIGSLAALVWFRLLRDRGVKIPYRQYILLGVPVTLAAILIALLLLNLQAAAQAW